MLLLDDVRKKLLLRNLPKSLIPRPQRRAKRVEPSLPKTTIAAVDVRLLIVVQKSVKLAIGATDIRAFVGPRSPTAQSTLECFSSHVYALLNKEATLLINHQTRQPDERNRCDVQSDFPSLPSRQKPEQNVRVFGVYLRLRSLQSLQTHLFFFIAPCLA